MESNLDAKCNRCGGLLIARYDHLHQVTLVNPCVVCMPKVVGNQPKEDESQAVESLIRKIVTKLSE
jgi:hypothetical protein